MPTVTLGGNDYDVFTAVADADKHLAGDVLRAAPWATRNADAKMRGLISATRMLLEISWCVEAPGFDDAPDVVQQVTAMLASDLLAKPKLFADASGVKGIKTVKAGSAQVEFFYAPVTGGPPLPKALWQMLSNAGLVCSPSDKDINAGPIVTGIKGDCRPLGGRYASEYVCAAEDHD